MADTLPPDVRLLIGIPTMGSVHAMLAARLALWCSQYPKQIAGIHFTQKVAPVDRARNQIVEFFLGKRFGEHGDRGFTHLLMIDSDTIPPADALVRLLSHDRPIVSGLTPIISYHQEKGWETFDNCFQRVEHDENGEPRVHLAQRRTGLQPIYRCGAACLLIEREVFKKIGRPHFRFVPNEDNTLHVRSEDIDFCDRVREAGYTIYADTDVICQHEKPVML